MAAQNASGGGAPRLTEGSYRFPRAMLKVWGASPLLRTNPALLPRQPIARERRPRLTTYDCSSTQARRKLTADSAVTTYDHDASRERPARMYVAAGGVALTTLRPSGCPASESEAQEP